MIRRVDEDDAFYDKDDTDKQAGPSYVLDEDEVDPLDAFMEENDQETIKDIQTTYQKAGMLTVAFAHLETTASDCHQSICQYC